MSRISAEDQLKFLLCCVKNANNGRIDFTEVAKECGVVSRGAASKRYDRLLKSNGIYLNGSAAKSEHKPTKRNADSVAKAAEAKRRKIEGDNADPAADDDNGVQPVVTKIEPCADTLIKQESDSVSPFDARSSTSPSPRYPHFQGYTSTAVSPTPHYPLSHFPPSNTSLQPAQSIGRMKSQILPPTAPPLKLSIDTDSQIVSAATRSTQLANTSSYEDSISEETREISKPNPHKQDNIPYPEVLINSREDDRVFSDFCSSELFMQPLQKKQISIYSPPPPSPPLCRSRHKEDYITAQLRGFPSEFTPQESKSSTSTQPECIIIDD